MSWARLDDTYCDHPKVLRAWSRHPAAVSLHVMSITYCARHRTDGRIPIEWLEIKVPKANDRSKILAVLVDAGLFDLRDGEYFVHDFLDYNGSREGEEQRRAAISQARSEAGRKGAQKRWQTDSNATARAIGKAEQDANGSNSSRPVPSRPVPIPPLPPKGKRARDRERWEGAATKWARSVGVDGNDASIVQAIHQAEPWTRNGTAAEHFRTFVATHFERSLTVNP